MSERTDSILPAVSASRVGKKFAKSLGQTLWYGLSDIGRELLLQKEAPKILRPGEFWAVQDVSFDLPRGEALAIIGRNGSGKSTLLKMLYGLFKPDAGEITIRGRMAALIELGAGFDPILSGRENAYINASILGLSREEIDELMPSIIEFSELRDFIDTPVKFYSSGMRTRLAYSVATKISPDILLVDEVLAVGDSDFRRKCIRNMVRFVEQGGSVIFTSHTANQIQTICSRGLVISVGCQMYEGSSSEALDYYYQNIQQIPEKQSADFVQQNESAGRVVSVVASASTGADTIRMGEPMSISVTVESPEGFDGAVILAILSRDRLTRIAVEESGEVRHFLPGRHVLRFEIPLLPLMPGLFHLVASLHQGERALPADNFTSHAPASFRVVGESGTTNIRTLALGQLVRIHGDWK